MAHGTASRNRDQYESVDDRKHKLCSCFYVFLISFTSLVLLAVVCGAGYAGYLVYTLRTEEDIAVTYMYDVQPNMTENLYPEPEDVSGGDIQYSKIVPYDPKKDAKTIEDEFMASPTVTGSPVSQSVTALDTASRIIAKPAGNKQNALPQPANPVAEVTDAELLTISKSLWKATRPAILKLGTTYKLAVGKKLNQSGRADHSPHKLFTVHIDLHKQSYTYKTFFRLLDNYVYVTQVKEADTKPDQREAKDFIQAVVVTPTMQRLHIFLVNKGLASSDMAAFHQQLWQMWFRLYNRSPKYDVADSSGFEHVFVGEIRKNKVIGLHSWIQLYQQEKLGKLNYQGYYKNIQSKMMSVRLKWNEKMLRTTSFFVGTPPEYDIAVYTLCALARIGEMCSIDIGGTRVSVRTVEVKHIDGVQIADAFIAM